MCKKVFLIGAALLLIWSSQASALDPNLIDWYEFDESSGSTANDSSDYNNDATVYYTDWASSGGMFAGAIDLGTDHNDYIEASATRLSRKRGTAMGWIKIEGTQSGTRYAFGHMYSGWANRIQIYCDGGNNELDLGLGGSHTIATNVETLSADTWYHVALTWDSNSWVFYLNGVEDSSGSYSNLNAINSTFHIGNNNKSPFNEGWQGKLDDWQVWDVNLSASEIQAQAKPEEATSPSPANSATGISITADLSWTAGAGATSHNVYFGTSSPGTFRGNQTATTYDCGTMANNTTYYWRIDEVNPVGTTTGTVWSFTTIVAAPGQASSPSPANSATDVSITADLSWTAGSGATSHNVYFGTSSPGTFQGNQAATTYDCGTMAYNTVYYWRIDEVNAGGTTTGSAWSFTTQTSGLDPNMVIWYELDESSGSVANDSSSFNNDGEANGVTWLPTGGAFDGAATTPDAADNVEYDTGDMLVSKGTIAINVRLVGTQSGTRYIYGHTSNPTGYTNRIQLYCDNSDNQLDLGLGDSHTKALNIQTLQADCWYHIALTWNSGTYYVYVDGVQKSTGSYTGLSTLGSYAMIGNSGHRATSENWDGRIDDARVYNRVLTQPQIADLVPETNDVNVAPPSQASSPSPANSATGISITADLSWTAGSGATSHNVYWGTSSPGTFRGNQTATTYDCGTMANNTTYYWRIDEVNTGGTTTGSVWSYTTIIAAPGQASSPSPANSATGVSITADLSWTAGSGATSHAVYFGTSSPGTYRTTTASTTYDCGTMSSSTTYYWRIDEINAGGTTTGNVWSFTTASVSAPGKATSPSPADSAVNVSTTADLSWTAGSGATSHNVYFGTSSPGTFRGNQAGTTYDCGTMTTQTVYYWRIDEVNTGGTTTGDVWAFRVGPLAAFPGAEGYGAAATGGRGGSVVKVTNLNTSGSGSLAAACATSGTRTIVFDVSGVIPAQVLLTQSNVTIAGQTAPGAGITIQGMLKSYGYAIDNAIIRFLRVRPNQPAPGGQTDAFQLGGEGTSTLILDHCSGAWGNDEVYDFYNANTVTLQWSTIEESDPCMHDKGVHNFGLISAATGSGWISIHHNLFTHHYRRVPCLAPYSGNGEFVSNVCYNCEGGYTTDGHGVNITGDLNLYNNYYARGPNCMDNLYPYALTNGVDHYVEDVYFENWGYQDHPCEWIPDWLPGGGPSWIQYNSAGDRIYSPATCSSDYPVTATAALTAYNTVRNDAGCFPRDRITTQNVADVNALTGAWRRTGPATPATSWFMYGLTAGSAPTDTDSDGMPDTWEDAKGLDHHDASDRNDIVPNGESTDNRHMGYTYLEYYINELAESLY